MLIRSIFTAASIVAVALTTLCLIFNGLWQFFSAKRSDPNQEGIELGEATRIENRDAEVSSIGTSGSETERVAEKREAEREEATSSSRRSVPCMTGEESGVGDEECEERREGVLRRYFGAVRVRDATRRDRKRESVDRAERESGRGAVRARGTPSLPPFKNTRRLKLSTLVLILYSAFFRFVSLPMFLWLTGNIILFNSISLMITSFSPLLLIRMEPEILSFVREILNRGELN